MNLYTSFYQWLNSIITNRCHVKKSSSSSNITSDNINNVKSTDSSLYNTNIQNNNQQDVTDSVNKSFDQTKDNINRSIEESKKQIPHFNNIVNSYQEQTLQAAKEISENFIESQKTIINSIQSAWRPYQQNYSSTANRCNSLEAVANAYSRFVSIVADNTISALRTTNNIIFSNFDSWKSVLQQAKDNSKQIFNQNVNAAKTFEQNTRELTAGAQDANTRFNASINNSNSGIRSNTNTATGTSSTTNFTSEA